MEDRAEIWTLKWQVCSLKPVQFSSVAQSCLTLWDPMYCSTPGFPVLHQLLKISSPLLKKKKKVNKTHWRSLKPFATLLLFPHPPNPWPCPCTHLMLLRTILCLRSTCPGARQWHLLHTPTRTQPHPSPGHSCSRSNPQATCLVLSPSFLSSPSKNPLLPPLDLPIDLHTQTRQSLLWELDSYSPQLQSWIEKPNNLTEIIIINCLKENSSCHNTWLYSYHQLWVLVDYAMPGKHLKRKLFTKLNCNSYKDTEFCELNKSDVGELLKRIGYHWQTMIY